MEVKKAVFIISNTELAKCPKPDKPEIAFIGRSNVGKSSLINMLANKRDLAKVSSTPGKTQLINHFLINDAEFWVELPGYGFAKVSQKKRGEWTKMIWNYVENRENLLCLFLLLDSRHAPQQQDIDFINKLGEKGVPFTLVFTKADKENQKTVSKNVQTYRDTLSAWWEELPHMIVTSSEKRLGRTQLLTHIETVCATFKASSNDPSKDSKEA